MSKLYELKLSADELDCVKHLLEQYWDLRQVQSASEALGIRPELGDDDLFDDCFSEITGKVAVLRQEPQA